MSKRVSANPVLGYARLDDGVLHLPAEELGINAQWYVNQYGGEMVRVQVMLQSDYRALMAELKRLRAGKGTGC